MELLGIILIFVLSPFEIYLTTNMGTISQLLGYVVFCVFTLQILRKGKISIPREGFFLSAFIILGMISSFWAFYPNVSLTRSITLIQLFFLFIITYNSFKNMDLAKTDIVYTILILCGVFISLYTVSQVFFLGSIREWTRISISEEVDVNHLASFLITPFLLGLHYSITRSSIKHLIPTLIVLSAIIFTQSRGAFVAIALSVGLYLFMYKGRGGRGIKFRYILVVLAGIFFVFITIPKEFLTRVYLMFTDKEVLLRGSGRNIIWGLAWQYFISHPINGIGLGNFTTLYRPPHSSFFQIVSELGLLGLGTISLFLLFLFFNSWKNKDKKPSIECTIVVALLIMSLTVDIFYRKYLWIMIGIYSAQKNEINARES